MLTNEELQQVYDYVLQQGRRIESLGTLPEGVSIDEIAAFPAVHTGSGTTAASLLVPMARAKEWMKQQATDAANTATADYAHDNLIPFMSQLRTFFEDSVEQLQTKDLELEDSITSEASARQGKDNELINAINVEANARNAADQNLEARAKIIHDLGTYTSKDSLLAAAAKINIVQMGDENEKRILIGKYDGGGNVVSVLILQHNVRTGTTTGTGSGTTMQYVFDGKQRYTRYIDHTATAVTSVQSLQPDGVRNLYFTAKGFIGLRDMWGTQVGSGFFLPDNTAIREDAANITATAVGLITTSFLGTTKTSSLGAVTSARAGVMTVALYNELKNATASVTDLKESLTSTQTTMFNKFEEVEDTESSHYAELQQHLTAIYNRLSSLETRIATLESLHNLKAEGDFEEL